MAMIEALGRAKLSRHWIQFRVTAYAVPLFSAIIDASLLYNVVAERPIPPVVDNTSGMNVARSTPRIRTRWSYSRLFSCSCLQYTDDRGPLQFDWALGLNTRTSTNAFSNLPPPEHVHCNIQASTIFSDCRAVRKGLARE